MNSIYLYIMLQHFYDTKILAFSTDPKYKFKEFLLKIAEGVI